MPEALDSKCKKLIEEAFARPQRRSVSKRIGSAIARAALVVLVMLGISTVTVLSVDAFRIPVLNFLLDKSGVFSTVVLDPNAQNETTDADPIVERFEANVPKGYHVISRNLANSHGTIFYKNSDDHLIYLHVENDECAIGVDAENVDYISVEFGEYYAVFWEKEGYHLMWLDSESRTVYRLWASDLGNQEFWELAYILIE